ncbi:MAG: U32 family peptidase [Mycoplasma sp.]
MKIIVSPANYKIIGHLVRKTNVDIIQVGIKNFSDKTTCLLNATQLKIVINLTKKHHKQIFVYLDAFYYEQDLSKLTKLLVWLNELKVDAIVFNDLAINQICYEQKLNLKLIYDPKALVTNYGQFNFYLKNNISGVVIANELKQYEVNELLANKKQIKIIKQVSGYVFMMQSRWDLVSLFLEQNKLEYHIKDQKLWIKEELRPFPSLIFENKYGTHIYTGYVLSNLHYLQHLFNQGLDYVYIDGLMHEDNWLIKTINIYDQAIKLIKNKQSIEELIHQEKALNKDEVVSSGFISNKLTDLMYLNDDLLKGVNNEK